MGGVAVKICQQALPLLGGCPPSSTEAPTPPFAPPPPAPSPAIRLPPRFLARASIKPGTRAWRLSVCVRVVGKSTGMMRF